MSYEISRLKVKRQIVILSIIILVLTAIPLPVHAEEDWSKWDIRTELADGITAETIDKRIEEVGGSNSWLVGHGKAVIDAGEANGINPVFMLAQLIKESGWKDGNYLSKNFNNYGNITGEGTAGSGYYRDRNWAKFNTPEEGLKGYAELLKRYTTGQLSSKKGQELTTIKQVIEVYAPPSENDVDKYISDVVSIMKGFGQGYDGSVMSGTGEYKDGNEKGKRAGSITKGLELLIEPNIAQSPNTGVKVGDAPLSADVGNWIMNISDKTKNAFYVLAWIVGALFLVYMSFCVLLYALTLRGSSNGELFQKITGLDSPYAKETIGGLIKRMAIGVSIFTFFASGAFVWTMEFIYTCLSKISNL